MRKRRKQIIVAIAIVLGSLSILVATGVALMFVLGLPFYLTNFVKAAPAASCEARAGEALGKAPRYR